MVEFDVSGEVKKAPKSPKGDFEKKMNEQLIKIEPMSWF